MEFLHDFFFLHNRTAEALYFNYAKPLPIIDYHNHLSPKQIAENHAFPSLTALWLADDHYKWRAMRANGVPEEAITGNMNDREKFKYWAGTVPHTLMNPLYIWTHLELKRYFQVESLLNPTSAQAIYDGVNEKLADSSYFTQGLLERMHVSLLCTTDDPADDLVHHQHIAAHPGKTLVKPAFRPDRAMDTSDPTAFLSYVHQLESVTNRSVSCLADWLDILRERHDFFGANGCTVSDHGLSHLPTVAFSESEAVRIFNRVLTHKWISREEQDKLSGYLLFHLCTWNAEKGWVQQFHLGPFRNTNTRLHQRVGNNAGCDAIGDFPQGQTLASFLDLLDSHRKLAKTILYNSNPADNALFASIAGCFQGEECPSKIQWGSAWWFLDQKTGIEEQLKTLSELGLLTRFVGMLTDSRSFLSFPRHEYFRRILCNMLGQEVEAGNLPNDEAWIGSVVQQICFYNARDYFSWQNQLPI